MIFKTAVCDDEEEGIELVKKYLLSYHFETGIEFDTTYYISAEKLLMDYSEPGKYDLIFLDVEMPGSDKVERGIEVAKQIRSLPDNDAIIIFISNYPEYMAYGYDVHAAHYLSKKTSFNRFKEVLGNVIHHLESDNSILSVKTGRDQKSLLKICDIIYVSSFHRERKYVVYKMKDGRLIEERKTILSVSEDLKPHGFSFANKYCLINYRYIQSMNNNVLLLDNQERIPLSRYYKKDFLSSFSKNVLKLSE